MWNLVEDKNIRYTVEASLRLLAVPIAAYLCARNVNLRTTVLVLGLVSAACQIIIAVVHDIYFMASLCIFIRLAFFEAVINKFEACRH